jgi:rhodanese-related sulfurtransferase
MKKLLALACVCCFIAGCDKPVQKTEEAAPAAAPTEVAVKTITADQLKEKLAATPAPMVVNVLAKESFEDCSIKGSINVPLADLAEASKTWDKAQEIVVYCSGNPCTASKTAYEDLTKMGFTNVVLFEGGMKEWHDKNFDANGECKADYLK